MNDAIISFGQQIDGRGWEVCKRVNRKPEHSGHKNIIKKLFVNGNIIFKFVKWVGNYVLIIHHLWSVLGTIYISFIIHQSQYVLGT